MDNFKDYGAFPIDRARMNEDIVRGRGQGIRIALLLEIMEKHGWSLDQLNEWFTCGEVKVGTTTRYEIITRRNR